MFELHDHEGERHSFFNMLCLGTKFQVVGYLGPLRGPPTSEECLKIFNQAWTTWAGYPTELHADRGVHNRGMFAKDLGDHGIAISPIGLQSPEQIGSVERHGDLWKAIAKRVISSKRLVGEEQIRRMTPEITMIKNDQSRCGGFSPSQWVMAILQDPMVADSTKIAMQTLEYCQANWTLTQRLPSNKKSGLQLRKPT